MPTMVFALKVKSMNDKKLNNIERGLTIHMPFSELGLSQSIVRGVRAAGYSEPTAIQAQAIPHILAGKDLIGTAQTGTGKTAAFVLPILQHLQDKEGLRCLILTPTRELAAQIETNVREYARFMRVRCAVVYGGVAMGPQIAALRSNPHILVATPGRLLDHMGRGNVRLDGVEILVLDEADRMLDMGFMPDVRRILQHLPKKRQNLLFSATMPREIESLARNTLADPVKISVGPTATPATNVSQFLYPVPHHLKMAMLLKLLQITSYTSILIFTRTKYRADKVANALNKNNYSAARLHGDRSQSQRSQALHGFRTGRYRIMVATDLAARGLDVEGISHVINYDVPETPEAYIHRIGRTARAQAVGDAFTLVSQDEERDVYLIEKHLKRAIPRVGVPDFEYSAPPPPKLAPTDRRPVGSASGDSRRSNGHQRNDRRPQSKRFHRN
jgi:ATP-dependent RNA helicase RhlE